MTSGAAIGLDVGGTKAAAVRIAPDGTVLARATGETPAEDAAAIVPAILDVAKAVADADVSALGVGAAGLVEEATGRLRFAPNIAWRDVDLAAALAELGVPVRVDNDCTTAAYGELAIGAARGARDVLYVGVGTGIGGGLVRDGSIDRGAHGFAGEIGHLVVEPGGPRCGCGNRGCWETVASGSAITRLGRERLGPDVDGYAVVERARGGDAAAVAILTEVGERLGEGIAGLVNVLDPELVVVGGGAATGAGAFVLDPARRRLAEAVEAADVRPEVPLVPAALGVDGAAIGAALRSLEAVA